MAVPKTYLMVAPAGMTADKAFGRGISFSEIVRGLRKLNSRICAWEPSDVWYPGQKQSITCLWIGPPSEPRSIKISGVSAGMVPEFTQLAPDGAVMQKGWRAIFDRVIKAKGATKEAIEREFAVSLEISEQKDTLCRACVKGGLRRPAVGANGLCEFHSHLEKIKGRR